MTRQNISTGTAANDGTGDTLRGAGTKINANFTELYTFLGGDADTLSSQLSFGSDGIIFEGSTPDAFETTLTAGTGPSADRTITLPDLDGTVVVNNSGTVMMSSLPTSDPNNAGQLWNDSGTLKISAG